MFFFRLLSRLPFGVLYLIADLLFLVLYRVIRYRRGVVEDNLRHAFPAREAREIRQLGKAYYRHLSQVVVEILKMLTISEQEIRKRIELEHADIVQNYIRGGSSVLILASHLCNWEWIAAALRLHAGCEAAGVYKPLSNPLFDRLMIDVRNRFGNTPLIPKETAVRDILRMHKNPYFSDWWPISRPPPRMPNTGLRFSVAKLPFLSALPCSPSSPACLRSMPICSALEKAGTE
jgi:Kdo2-lipid IVA lauroyltransferase/acyltransferase